MEIADNTPALSIKPGDVHVWVINLTDPGKDRATWDQLLSAEETDHSKHYKFDKDRLHFIARRGILRLLLGHYTGMDLAEINFRTNPYGKLSLPSHPLSFNLSFSLDRVAYVFTFEKDVGVDIEQVRPLPDLLHLVKSWFSLEEQVGLFALDPAIQVEAFFHIWTQKEAFTKAHGEGMSLPLKDFSVSIDPNKPGRLLAIKGGSEETSHWKMATNHLEAGCRVAMCVRAEAEPEILWTMKEEADFVSCDTSRKSSLSV